MAACGASGGASSSRTDGSEMRRQVKKPRRCFTAYEDLCILREVAATRPFGDDHKWVRVVATVNRVVGRVLTLRGVKDRVDILLGYWKTQDAKNLKKSGTEEEYAEKEVLLQDLWDYAESVNYQPRVTPRSAGSAARRRRQAPVGDPARNSEELPWVPHWDDGSGDGTYSAAADSQCGQTREAGPSAAELLESVYREHAVSPSTVTRGAEPGQVNSDQLEHRASPELPQQQQPSPAGQEHHQPPSTQPALPATSRGIRGLQGLGLQLLAMREKNEFALRTKELEIEQRKVRNEERRLDLEERRLALEEEKHRFEVSRWEQDRQKLLEHIEKMFDEQNKKLSQHHSS